MHPISSMTGFFDLKFCNLIHNSEYISLCILEFLYSCSSERKLLYSQSYCIVFAYLVVCKHIRMHSRTHPAYTNTNTTQTRSFLHSAYAKHGETHTRTQPRPRNMPGAASQWHMARVWRRYEGEVAALEQSRWILATFVMVFSQALHHPQSRDLL